MLEGRFRRGRWSGEFDPCALADLSEQLDRDPDDLVARGLLVQVHSSRGARVFRSGEGSSANFYWKEFRARGALDPLKAWLRGSRAARAVRGAERLAAIGVDAPRTLALVEERGAFGVARAVLVTEAVLDRVGLEHWAVSDDLASRDRRRIVTAAAVAVAAIHRAGLVHGDLRPSNVLVDRAGDRVTFLDNERTRPSRRRRERLRNLVQLGVDQLGPPFRTDRLRFVHAYVRASGGSRDDARELARAANAAILARREKRRRRGLDPLTGLALRAGTSCG